MEAVLISGLAGVEEGLKGVWEEGKELQAHVRFVLAKRSWSDDEVNDADLSVISSAEVLVGDPPLLALCLRSLASRGLALSRLQWIHCTWAGPDALLKALGELDGLQLGPTMPRITRSVGYRMRGDLASFVVGRIIEQERMFVHSRQQQARGVWDQEGVRAYRCLRDLTVAVMGVGAIGTAVANSAAFLGMTVIGLNTRGVAPAPEEDSDSSASIKTAMVSGQMLASAIEAWYPVSRVAEVLPQCDFLVNVLPSSPATRGLLSGDAFKPAGGRTTFINIGRGDIIDEQSLLHALEEKWIAGAILDVHYQEPLPSTSRLWRHTNVTISPHVGSVSSAKDIVKAFRIELGLLLQNQPADKPVLL